MDVKKELDRIGKNFLEGDRTLESVTFEFEDFVYTVKGSSAIEGATGKAVFKCKIEGELIKWTDVDYTS